MSDIGLLNLNDIKLVLYKNDFINYFDFTDKNLNWVFDGA